MAAPTINYAKVAAMAPQPVPMQQHQMQQQQMPPRQPGQQGGDWKASAQIPAKDNRLKTTVRSPALFLSCAFLKRTVLPFQRCST